VSYRGLDWDIGGIKEGGTTLLASVAELASDLPQHSPPKTTRCQRIYRKFELACAEMTHHTAPHATNPGRHCRR